MVTKINNFDSNKMFEQCTDQKHLSLKTKNFPTFSMTIVRGILENDLLMDLSLDRYT